MLESSGINHEHHSGRLRHGIGAGDVPHVAGKRMLQAEALIEVIYVDGTRKKIDLNAGSDAYQTMIAAALRGSRREFVGREEVFALWRYADHAAKCWDEVPLEIYGAVDGVDKPFLIQ